VTARAQSSAGAISSVPHVHPRAGGGFARPARRARGAGSAARGGTSGQSRVIVITGEPGVGKTALWSRRSGPRRVPGHAGGRCRVRDGARVRCTPAVVAPMLEPLERLPHPQQDARRGVWAACGRPTGSGCGLMSDVAQEQPLPWIADDAQWLDRASAQALVFVARRLLAESVASVLTTRDSGDELEDCRGWRSRAL
jgi:hypothetical protein